MKLKIQLYKLLHNPVFIISIKSGKVMNEFGNVKQTFIDDCQDIVNQNKISKGLICLTKSNNRIVISNNISQSDKQRFRNAWSFSNY